MRRTCAALIAGLVLAAFPAAASAGAVHARLNQQIPFAGFQAFVPCTGDTITFTQGWLHDMAAETQTATRFSISFHDQPHNTRGADTSGRQYIAVGITREHDAGSLVNGQAITQFVNNFHLVAVGGGPSYLVHEVAHVTVNARGQISVIHDRLRVVCG